MNLAAMVSGYAAWILFGFVAISFVRDIKKSFTCGEGKDSEGQLPLHGVLGIDRVQIEKRLADIRTPRSFNGDGVTLQAWHLRTSEDSLRRLVSNDTIHDNRIWFCGPLDKSAQQAVDFVKCAQEYPRIQEIVEEVLGNGKFSYSYNMVRRYDGRVSDCAIWLLDPEKKILIYLNLNT